MPQPYPTRRTLRLDVEVTIDEYDAAYDSRDLADDLREDVFRAIMDTVPRDVVLMTVTAADAPPPEPEPGAAHEFTGTVKRADGVTITATLSVPDTHPMAQPGPHRPWHGPDRPNQNFLELGELAMMIAQRGYGIIESNERSREHWGRQDYWADLLNITPPTPELEGPKEDVVFLVGKELPGER
jgi:hypothetical protein